MTLTGTLSLLAVLAIVGYLAWLMRDRGPR